MSAEWVDAVAQAAVAMAQDWLQALGGLIALVAAVYLAGLLVATIKRLGEF